MLVLAKVYAISKSDLVLFQFKKAQLESVLIKQDKFSKHSYCLGSIFEPFYTTGMANKYFIVPSLCFQFNSPRFERLFFFRNKM